MQTQYTSAWFEQLCSGGIDFSNDTFKVALYTASATLDADTAAYTTDAEVSGSGYTAGGLTLVAASGYPQAHAGGYALHFDDATWSSATLTARAALIYNVTASNLACLIIDFGQDVAATGGDWVLTFSAMSNPALRVH